MTISLCVLLIPNWAFPFSISDPNFGGSPVIFYGISVIACIAFVYNLAILLNTFKSGFWKPFGMQQMSMWRLVNRYGLFASMTTVRNENHYSRQ